MKIKEQVDIVSKKAEIIYKKVVILLASAGGSGAYAIKFTQESHFFLGAFLWLVFIFGIIDLGTLYQKIDFLEKRIEV
jgi:hypothetical protein